MIKRILQLFWLPLIGATLVFADEHGEVIKDRINVRADSTITAQTICMLKKGETVEIAGEKFDWYSIILPKDFTAYLSKHYVDVIAAKRGKINATRVNLRLKPSLEAPLVGTVEENSLVTIVGKNGDWYQVKAYPYARGWVNKHFIASHGERAVADLVAQLADPGTRKAARRSLIAAGDTILPQLDTYIGQKGQPRLNYDLIAVMGAIARTKPQAISGFFAKLAPGDAVTAAVYLDAIQDALAPTTKLPYYYYAEQGKLTARNVLTARDYLADLYAQSGNKN